MVKEHSLEEKTKALLLGGAEKSLPGTVCHWSGEITAAVCRLSEGYKQRRGTYVSNRPEADARVATRFDSGRHVANKGHERIADPKATPKTAGQQKLVEDRTGRREKIA